MNAPTKRLMVQDYLQEPMRLPTSRRTRRASRAAVLSCLLAPGLIAAAPGQADTAPTTLPWDLLDCAFLYSTTTTAPENVQPFLSPGFTPRVVDVGGGVLRALVSFEAEVCASGAGLEGQVPGMVYSGVSTPVVPPAALVLPHITSGHYQSWLHIYPDADRRAVLAAAGAEVHDGTVDITTVVAPDGSAMVRHALVDIEGFGTLTIDAVAQPAPLPRGGRFVDYNPAGGKTLVAFETDWPVAELYTGTAVVTFPPGSWVAQMFGGLPIVRANTMAGTWSYTDGTITFPVVYE